MSRSIRVTLYIILDARITAITNTTFFGSPCRFSNVFTYDCDASMRHMLGLKCELTDRQSGPLLLIERGPYISVWPSKNYHFLMPSFNCFDFYLNGQNVKRSPKFEKVVNISKMLLKSD